jgi:hypothetical protein
MPQKVYKHIKVPHQLVSRETRYIPPAKRYFPPPYQFNRAKHKKRIYRSIGTIQRFYDDRRGELFLEDEKGNNEIKIKFNGSYNPDLVNKYGLEIYEIRQDRGDNETIFAKVSNTKLEGQDYSDFERLQRDIEIYKESETDKFKTFFDSVTEIKPLELSEIVKEKLLTEIETNHETSFLLDVSFAGDVGIIEEKMSKIIQDFGEQFVSKINREALHFCRIKANFEEVKRIASQFDGITKIEKSPVEGTPKLRHLF